jgi:putative endonuclease
MTDLQNLGSAGEDIAVKYLKDSGYMILKRNWKSGKLEIDIIAENKEFIVFVEVKTRSADYIEDPRTAINRDKQRSMQYAAENYIKWNKVDKESRFDVIIIVMKDDKPEIDHIENAFYPTLR